MTSEPAVIALELVNGSNFTALVPAFIVPVRDSSLVFTDTSEFVVAIADSIESAPVVAAESKINAAGPVELKLPGPKTADSLVAILVLVPL